MQKFLLSRPMLVEWRQIMNKNKLSQMHTVQDRKESGWVAIPGRAIQSKVPKKGIPGVGPSGTFHSCPRGWGLLD